MYKRRHYFYSLGWTMKNRSLPRGWIHCLSPRYISNQFSKVCAQTGNKVNKQRRLLYMGTSTINSKRAQTAHKKYTISQISNLRLEHLNLAMLNISMAGGKGWLGFPDLWSGQNPMELNLCDEFWWSPEGPVSQIHYLHLHVVPLGSFKVCSDANGRVRWGKQREATVPIYP